MSLTREEAQKHIRAVLSRQGQLPKPAAQVCAAIAGLRDLVDLTGGFHSDWRRGSPTTGGGRGGASTPGGDSGHGSKRYGFRSGGGGGTGSSVTSGGGETPMSRVSSSKSFPSDLSNHGSPVANSSTPPPPVAKYQSRFKNSNQPVEDKILNNIILSKLNKFSPKTYDEIRDFLYQVLGSGEPDLQDMIRHFMRLVFRKAAVEEMFCPLYAKLLCEISTRYSVILTEMHALQANYLSIFDDVQEGTGSDYTTFVESQRDKQYRRGYSQFLAELAALELLDLGYLKSSFERILSNMVSLGKEEEKKTLLEEYSVCLVRMASVLKRRQSPFFLRARQTLREVCEQRLSELIEHAAAYQSVSAKTKFMLMDVQDCLKGS
jgi:hypothetical protein